MVSAGDLLGGRAAPAQLAGRSVVIARTDIGVDHFVVPGTGLVPAIMFHIIAAETLLGGAPVDLGWLAPLALALLLGLAILRIRRRTIAVAVIGVAVMTFFARAAPAGAAAHPRRSHAGAGG